MEFGEEQLEQFIEGVDAQRWLVRHAQVSVSGAEIVDGFELLVGKGVTKDVIKLSSTAGRRGMSWNSCTAPFWSPLLPHAVGTRSPCRCSNSRKSNPAMQVRPELLKTFFAFGLFQFKYDVGVGACVVSEDGDVGPFLFLLRSHLDRPFDFDPAERPAERFLNPHEKQLPHHFFGLGLVPAPPA